MKNFYEQSITKKNKEGKVISTKWFNYGLMSLVIPVLGTLALIVLYTSVFGSVPNSTPLNTIIHAFIPILIVVFMYAKFVEKRNPATLGFVKAKPALFGVFMVFASIVLFLGNFLFWATAGFPKVTFNEVTLSAILSAVYLLVVQTLAEELLYRGIVMQSFLRLNREMKFKTNIIIAVLISSVAFAVVHFQTFMQPLPIMIPSLLALFLAGALLGLIALRYGMFAAWGFHFGYNFTSMMFRPRFAQENIMELYSLIFVLIVAIVIMYVNVTKQAKIEDR